MATELNSLSLLASGFGDGMVKIFDKRLEEDEAVVHLCGGHASWVQNVCWSPTHGKQFLSARFVSFACNKGEGSSADPYGVLPAWMEKSGSGISAIQRES